MPYHQVSLLESWPVTTTNGFDRHTRAIAKCSNNTLISCIWVDNFGGAPGAGRLQFYKQSDGLTWVHLFNWDSNMGAVRYSITTDSNDDIHVAIFNDATSHVFWAQFNRTGTDTWATTPSNLEDTGLASGDCGGRVDLTVIDGDRVIIAATRILFPYVRLNWVVRHGVGGTPWGSVNEQLVSATRPPDALPLAGDLNTEMLGGYISIAQDMSAAVANVKRFMVLVQPADQCYWYLYGFETNITTGAQVGSTRLIADKMFGASAKRWSIAMIFATNTNEWSVGAVTGIGNDTKVWASRLSWTGYTHPETSMGTTSSVNGFLYARCKGIYYTANRIYFAIGDRYQAWTFVGVMFARFDNVTNKIFISPRHYADTWEVHMEPLNFMHGNAKNFTDPHYNNNIIFYSGATDAVGVPAVNYRHRIELFAHIPENAVSYPPAGSTVNTDRPWMMTPIALGEEPRVKGAWDLSTASDFSQNFRRVVAPDSAFQGSGTMTYQLPAVNELFQTTWYIRPQTTSEFGQLSFPGPTTSFIVSHPPQVSLPTPTGNEVIQWNVLGNQIKWKFVDTSPSDFQTAYQVQVINNTSGASVIDTGKVTSQDQFYNAVIPAPSLGQTLKWRVRLWDSDDVAGLYNNYSLFRPYQAPTMALTPPGTIMTPVPTFAWTFTPGTAGAQTQIRLVVSNYPEGTVVYDSGKINHTASTFTLPRPVLTKGNRYTVNLTTYDAVGLLAQDEEVNIPTNWTGPTQPFFNVLLDDYDDNGFVRIAWSSSVVDPNFYKWRVYRRDEENPEWVLVGETASLDAQIDMLDVLAPAHLLVDYTVVQVKIFSGTEASMEIESDVGAIQSVQPEATKYWMVEEGLQGLSSAQLLDTTYIKVPVEHVTGDSFTEKYESAIHNVPGRGNKRDVGQRWGYDGSLTAQLYGLGDLTPRQERKQLELMRQQRRKVWLRTPFGDVWQITLGEVQVQRIEGVGVNEYTTVTIPYTEVS
jgi:hypothetical protein